MKLTIRDMQVVERADIEIGDGITLVAGRNSQGKSTVAKVAAAVLTGRIQIGGITKKEAKQLVRAGRTEGNAAVTFPDGAAARALWPKCEFATEGTVPKLSLIAAGLEHPVDSPDTKAGLAERAALFSRLLKANITMEDFAQACADRNVPGDIGVLVWRDIEALGWDKKLADVREKGTGVKRRWEDITGSAYGSEKSKGWRPQGWTDDLAMASEEALLAAVTEAERALEEAIRAQGADQAEVERLTAACSDIDKLRTAADETRAAAAKARDAFEAAQKVRDALPPAVQDEGMCCPECQARLKLQRGPAGSSLVKAERITDDELKRRRLAIADADGVLSSARAAVSTADATLRGAEQQLHQAETAARQLEELRAKGEGGGSAADVEAARARLATAKARSAAAKAKRDADHALKLLEVNQAVAAIMAPDGLPQTKLLRVLDAFNDGPLKELCEAARWQTVRIEPDMDITFGGRPYALLAGHGPQLSSDQYRVRAVLQVALAMLQGDPLVILDAADVLDHLGRGGLIRMLAAAGIPKALVCMTYGEAKLVPNLERAGKGRTYWIDAGVAQPLADVLQPEKEAA